MVSHVAWFKDLNKNSIPVAGGKGSNLGEMFNLGIPVPNGFAITAQTYAEYLERTRLKDKIQEILKGLNVEDTTQLQQVAEQIQNLIISTPIPEDIAEDIMDNYELLGADKNAHALGQAKEVFVAGRSSATAEDLPDASFAGQQATYLNVKGRANVVHAVLACWASLFTARAVYYRKKKNFDNSKVLISAIVQKMVNSEKSGVMFTVNPATNNGEETIIQAIYGLGEMIVSGQVNPDSYLIDKKNREIKQIIVKKKELGLFRNERGDNEQRDISKQEQERQVLDEKQIKELARLGKKLEDHYQKPQDVEWAVERGEIFIVQTRAVTTFKEQPTALENASSILEDLGRILVRGETASAGVASGRVKLVKTMADLNKVQKGDILVTKMTTPDMVPGMQRAAAIVTDEGGLTCHAAIVSREMGTPCLVGTEHGTEVLKENQVVTVHASKGVVYDGNVKVSLEVKPTLSAPSLGSEIITATEVKVIMDLHDAAEHAAATGADGVGLVRLEIMIANGGIHPAEYIRQGRDEDYI